MSIFFIIVIAAYIIGCAAFITIILMQKKRSGGIGSISGMGNVQTYWDKNKGNSLEGKLETYTKIGGVVFFVLSFIICFIW